MASLFPSIGIITNSILILLILISLPSEILTEPTIAECTPRLLPLTPCAPFVQGLAQSPPPICCGNLRQLYRQQPGCVCVLLNNTNLSPFPINSTLALRLPSLCRMPLKNSDCSGLQDQPQAPTGSQVSLGTHNNSSNGMRRGHHSNSSVASSPMVQVAPRPLIPFGFGRSAGFKLETQGLLVLLVTLSAVLLT